VPTLFVSRSQKAPPPTVGAPPMMGVGAVSSRTSHDPAQDLEAPTVATKSSTGPKIPGKSGVVEPPEVLLPKVPHVPGDAPFARVRGMVSDQPRKVVASTSGADGAAFAPEATWAESAMLGCTGLHADAEIWAVDQKLGVDVRGGAAAYRLRVGDTAPVQVPIEVEGGLRWKVLDDDAVSIAPGVGAMYATDRAVIYADSGRTRAAVTSIPLLGARVGASARYEDGATLVSLDLQSVWTPMPTIVRGELGFDVAVAGPILLTAAVGGDLRWVHLASDTADARVNLREMGADLRLGVGFAAF
jgi:hypothetical protein